MTTAAVAKQAVIARIDALAPELVQISHAIHHHPELAYGEHLASTILSEALRRGGMHVQHPAYGIPTSFEATAGNIGPRVVVCCEYDALAGIGHACGHNVIAAAGVGAGLALQPLADQLAGRITVLGTPAEEGGGGKILLADRDAFADADAVMLTHPGSEEVVTPHINAVATLQVTMTGRAAHASLYPERGINALDGMVLAYNGLAALRQHLQPTDKVHGIFTDGGQLPNVVPARAAGTFLVRAADGPALHRLQQRVLRCFEGAACATAARLDAGWQWPTYTEMWHSVPLAEAFEANLHTLGRRPIRPSQIPLSRAGSTDLGNVSHLVPAIHPKLAISPPTITQHTPAFATWAVRAAADRAVIDGAKAMAMTTIDLWLQPGLVSAARRRLNLRAAVALAVPQIPINRARL